MSDSVANQRLTPTELDLTAFGGLETREPLTDAQIDGIARELNCVVLSCPGVVWLYRRSTDLAEAASGAEPKMPHGQDLTS